MRKWKIEWNHRAILDGKIHSELPFEARAEDWYKFFLLPSALWWQHKEEGLAVSEVISSFCDFCWFHRFFMFSDSIDDHAQQTFIFIRKLSKYRKRKYSEDCLRLGGGKNCLTITKEIKIFASRKHFIKRSFLSSTAARYANFHVVYTDSGMKLQKYILRLGKVSVCWEIL